MTPVRHSRQGVQPPLNDAEERWIRINDGEYIVVGPNAYFAKQDGVYAIRQVLDGGNVALKVRLVAHLQAR